MCVTAENLTEALDKAIEEANNDTCWKSGDAGNTHVDAVAPGEWVSPWENGLDVPDEYKDPSDRKAPGIDWQPIDTVPTDQEVLFFSLDRGPFCGFAERGLRGSLYIDVSYSVESVDVSKVTHWAAPAIPQGVTIGDNGYELAA